MGKAILLVSSLIIGNLSFGQQSMKASEIGSDWTLFTTQNGVEIYVKQDKCDVGAKELLTYAHVRLNNTTDVAKTVDFNFEIHHTNGCAGCGNTDEYRKSVSVPATGSIEGDCSFKNPELSLLINNPYQIGLGALEFIEVVQLIIE